jgi:hypothetical protein
MKMNESVDSEEAKEWCTKRQVSSHFGVGVRTITNWMQRRILPYVKIGGVVRFHLPDCEAAMRKFEIPSKMA